MEIIIAISVIAICVLLIFAFDCRLKDVYYSVQTQKNIGSSPKIRIVLISDLHSRYHGIYNTKSHGKNQEKLIDRIQRCNPDIVVIAGDLFDDHARIDGAVAFLKGIQNTKIPTFYAPGNHEYRSKRFDSMMNTVEKHGVTILEDKYCTVSTDSIHMRIAGAADTIKTKYHDPSYSQTASTEAAFSSLDDDIYNLLILHRPRSIALYKKYPFDLAVSGHLHGGQLRVPFVLNGLFTPSEGFFPKYAGGAYKHGSMTHIVGRGVSVNPPFVPRVFNRTELVVIDIGKEEEHYENCLI